MTTAAPNVVPATAYQSEIYLAGLTGAVPELPTDLTRLETLARDHLGPVSTASWPVVPAAVVPTASGGTTQVSKV